MLFILQHAEYLMLNDNKRILMLCGVILREKTVYNTLGMFSFSRQMLTFASNSDDKDQMLKESS